MFFFVVKNITGCCMSEQKTRFNAVPDSAKSLRNTNEINYTKLELEHLMTLYFYWDAVHGVFYHFLSNFKSKVL